MNNYKETLVVNLFAGPGAGKSTGAAYIFSKLKMLGVDCELVTEFAKDKIWEGSSLILQNQLYIFGKQSWRMSRCKDKVKVIITDSPLVLSTLYCDKNEPWYNDLINVIIKEFNKYSNYNYFINRVKEYNPNGRYQTEDEAVKLDSNLRNMLNNFSIKYSEMPGCVEGYDNIVEEIYSKIKKEIL